MLRYNQGKGGRVCYDSEVSYCDNLSASMVFDTEKLMLVQQVALFIQDSKSAPRSWTISYSLTGLEGPFREFAHTTRKDLKEGEVALPALDGGVVAARYWKIEITSNWGADEVELREVRLLGCNNADLHMDRRLEDSMEITVDGSSLEASDYVLKYTFKDEAPLYYSGHQLSVVRVNDVTLASGQSGNKNVLVVGQPKTFQVSISNREDYENDVVKYVEGTDCSASAFGQEFPLSSNGTFTVVFYDSTSSRLSLCYHMKFEADSNFEDYFMIPGEVYLELRTVNNLIAPVGANDFAVYGVQKLWRADVLGHQVGDKIGFQINGVCELTNYDVSGFNFTFNYDSVQGNDPEIFPLCYKFYGEAETVFPGITVRVGHLDSLQALSGNANVMITDFEKVFTVDGVGVASGDQIFLTQNDDSCDSSSAVVKTVPGSLQIALVEAVSGTYNVCYKFGEEPFYRTSVVMNAYEVSVMARTGASDVLVVDQEKIYDADIIGPNSHLFSGMITLNMGSCSGEVVPQVSSSNYISITLLRNYSEPLVICYTLQRDNIAETPKPYYSISLKEFIGVQIEGVADNSYIIAENNFVFSISGRGIEDTDTLFLVDETESCQNIPALVFPVSNHVAVVNYTEGNANLMRVCYRFAAEVPVSWNTTIKVFGVNTDLNSITFREVDAYFHLEAVPIRSDDDEFTFVLEGDQCPQQHSVYSKVAPEGELNKYLFESDNIATFELCYYFSTIDRFAKLPSRRTLLIDRVLISANDGYSNLAFSYVTKTMSFSGSSVQEGDRVKYVVNSCNEDDYNKAVTGLDYYTLGAAKSLELSFTAPTPTLHLCYSFAKYDPNTPKFYYFVNDEYSMRAIGYQNVTVNRGDDDLLISGVHKTFTLSALEVTLTSFYYAEQSLSCDASNMLDNRLFSLTDDSALVIYAGCYQDQVFRLCVNFDYKGESFVADVYTQQLEIVTFTSVQATTGEKDVLVAMFDKPFQVEGCNLVDEATFILLDTNYDPLSDSLATFKNDTLFLRAPPSCQGREVRLAVQIRNEPLLNLDSSIFMAYVYGVTEISKSMFVMRNADTISFTTAYNVPYTVFFTTGADESCSNTNLLMSEPLTFTKLYSVSSVYDRFLYWSELPVNFTSSTFGEDYYACVKFGNEQFYHYGPNIDYQYRVHVYVKGVYEFSSLTQDIANDLIVADKEKGFRFLVGSGDSLSERIMWVLESEDCANYYSSAVAPTLFHNMAQTLSVTISRNYSQKTLKMCYWFDSVLVSYPEYHLSVLQLLLFEFIEQNQNTSSNAFAVIYHNKYARAMTEVPPSYISTGMGTIKFVSPEEDCSADRPIFSQQNNNDDFDFVINDNGDMPSYGLLCYKFENEDFYRFDEYSLSMIQLLRLKADKGTDYRVVANYSKPFTLVCNNCSNSDILSFTPSEDACASDYSSGDHLIFNTYYKKGGNLTFTFTTDSSINTLGLHSVCYEFSNYWDRDTDSNRLFFSNLNVTIAHIYEPTVSSGSVISIVMDQSKRFYFSNSVGVSNKDVFTYIPSNQNCNPTCTENCFTLDDDKSANVVFTIHSNDEFWSMCYYFVDEGMGISYPYKLLIHAVTSLTSTPTANRAFVNSEKLVYLTGSGIRPDDRVKYVKGDTPCSSTDETLIVTGTVQVDSIPYFRVKFTEVTSSVLDRYQFCYKFGAEDWQKYSDYYMEVLDVSPEDYAEFYSSSKAIVDQRKRIIIDLNDPLSKRIKFVAEADTCLAGGAKLDIYDPVSGAIIESNVDSAPLYQQTVENRTFAYIDFAFRSNSYPSFFKGCIIEGSNENQIRPLSDDYTIMVVDIPVLSTMHIVSDDEKDIIVGSPANPKVTGYGRHQYDMVFISSGDCMDADNGFNATSFGFTLKDTYTYNKTEGAINTYNVCYQPSRERRMMAGTLSVVILIDAQNIGLPGGLSDLLRGLYPETIELTIAGYKKEFGPGRIMFIDSSKSDCKEEYAFNIYQQPTSMKSLLVSNSMDGRAIAVVKAESEIFAESYKICYKHGEDDKYHPYFNFTFNMLVVNNVTVDHGRTNLFVVGQPKSVNVDGIGLNDDDTLFFSLDAERNTTTSIDATIFAHKLSELPMSVTFEEEQEGSFYAYLYSTTYEIVVKVFDDVTRWNPSIATPPDVYPVYDMDNRIVYMEPTEFVADGQFVSNDDTAAFIPSWVTSCDSVVPSDIVPVINGRFTITVQQHEYFKYGIRICYRLGEEQWIRYDPVYSLITVDVATGSTENTAVVGLPKEFVFYGDYISENDHYKWVKRSLGSCAMDDSDAEGFIENGIRSVVKIAEDQVMDNVTFTRSSRGEELALCWQYKNGPFHFIQTFLNLKSIDSFHSEFGDDETIFYDIPKTYLIEGYGQSENDYVQLSPGDDPNCSNVLTNLYLASDLKSVVVTVSSSLLGRYDSFSLCYVFSGEKSLPLGIQLQAVIVYLNYTSSLFLEEQYTFTITGPDDYVSHDDSISFVTTLEECYMNATTRYYVYGRSIPVYLTEIPIPGVGDYSICFCFNESCFVTNNTVSLYHITDVTATDGGAHALIYGLSKNFEVDGVNVHDGDAVMFNCVSNPSSSIGPFVVSNYMITVDESLFIKNFALACDEATLTYSFGSLEHAFDLIYSVSVVNTVENVPLLYNKTTSVTITGRDVEAGDKVKLGVSSCSEEDSPVFVVEKRDPDLVFEVNLKNVTSHVVKVCYLFTGEQRYADTGLTLNAYMVTVEAPENNAVIVNHPYNLPIHGVGLSVQDDVFVSRDQTCSSVAWNYHPTQEETNWYVTITIPSVEDTLYICYKFVSVSDIIPMDTPFRASNITVDVDQIVNRVELMMHVTGAWTGDMVSIAPAGAIDQPYEDAAAACASSEYIYVMDNTMTIEDIIVLEGLLPVDVYLCYAVNSIWVPMLRLPFIGLSNIVPSSVVANNEYTFFVNATNISGDCKEEKLHFDDSWVSLDCQFTNNLYMGTLANAFNDDENAAPIRLGGSGANQCSNELSPNGNYIILDLGSCYDVTKLSIKTGSDIDDVKELHVFSSMNKTGIFSEAYFDDYNNILDMGIVNNKSINFSGSVMKLEFTQNYGHLLYTTVHKIYLYGHPCSRDSNFAVKYVAESESCDDVTEVFEVSVCSQEFTHTFNSSYDGKHVCFKHPMYSDYVLYPNITMEMKYVSGFNGSNQLGVNTSRRAQLIGKGIQAGDVAKFVPVGFTCNYVTTEFTVGRKGYITLTNFDTLGEYSLCYKFTNSVNYFLPYSNIILEVVEPYVSAVVPNWALVGRKTLLQFIGAGITESDHVKFVSSDKGCNDSGDNSIVYALSADGTVNITFASPLPSGKVCYRFGLNATFIDPGILFEVYSISAVYPTEFVDGLVERTSFYGVGITVNDEVALVDPRFECKDASLHISLNDATVDVVANEVVLTKDIVLTISDNRPVVTMAICYKLFAVNEYIRLSQTLTIYKKTLTVMNLDNPAYTYYVSGRRMTYRVEGYGVGRSDTEKVALLSQSGGQCENVGLSEGILVTREMDGVGQFTLEQETKNTPYLRVCYLFAGQSKFEDMGVQIPVLMIRDVYLEGHPSYELAVFKNTDNVLSVEGYNIQTGDRMKFVDRMGQAEYSCLSSGSALHGQDEVTLTLIPSTGRTQGVFRFTEAGLNLAMCYFFSAHNEMVLFPNIQLDVLDVAYESENVAVLGEPYEMSFSGAGQKMGDEVMWVRSAATDCSSPAMMVSTVEVLDESLNVTFVFNDLYRNLKLCVRSDNGPWTMLSEYTLDVVGVSVFDVPAYTSWKSGSDYTIMANAPVDAIFNTGDEGDSVKFIPDSSECNSDLGVCGKVDLVGTTKATLSCAPATKVVLCYYFSRLGRWKKYSQFGLTVNGPTALTNNVVVEGINMIANVALQGVNVADQCNEECITSNSGFIDKVSVESNDPSLLPADLKQALGNTQYGIQSEFDRPLEIIFRCAEHIAITAMHVHAPRSTLSPRTMNVYRMESEKYVLAFSWVTEFDDNNQAVKSDTTGFHGTSNTWKLEIVDTFAEDPSDAMYNYTYFTGIDIYVNNGVNRNDVKVKFVPEDKDCSADSAMVNPIDQTPLDEVYMDGCSGLLESFTVSDISQTFRLCYAQTSAPAGYNDFVSYDLTFMIRNTKVESEGLNDHTIAGYEKTLYLDAGEYIPTSIKFVVSEKTCSEMDSAYIYGPIPVHNNTVSVTFNTSYVGAPLNKMRLCVRYGSEDIYEPQNLVMKINEVNVPNFEAYWTMHEVYSLQIEGTYWYQSEGDVYVSGDILNNTVVVVQGTTGSTSSGSSSTGTLIDYSNAKVGIADITFTSYGEMKQLYMFVREFDREIPLTSNGIENLVKVTVYTFGELSRTRFLVGMTYNNVKIENSFGVTEGDGTVKLCENPNSCLPESFNVFEEEDGLMLELGLLTIPGDYQLYYSWEDVKNGEFINTQVSVQIQNQGPIVFTNAPGYFIAGSQLEIDGNGVDEGDEVIVRYEDGTESTPYLEVKRDGDRVFIDTAGYPFTESVVYMYYKFYNDASDSSTNQPIFVSKLDVLMVSVDFTENNVVTEYPYHFRASGLNIDSLDTIVLASDCSEDATVYGSWSTEQGINYAQGFVGEHFRVVFDEDMTLYAQPLRLCYNFSRYDVYANLQAVTVELVKVSTDSSEYFATRGDVLDL